MTPVGNPKKGRHAPDIFRVTQIISAGENGVLGMYL
jgi:hypothetical protein